MKRTFTVCLGIASPLLTINIQAWVDKITWDGHLLEITGFPGAS